MLFDFAGNVKSPSDIGNTLIALENGAPLTQIIVSALDQEGHRKQFARGFIWRTSRNNGREWTDKFLNLDILNSWDSETCSLALLCLPFEHETLDIVESFDETTHLYYWRGISHVFTDDLSFYHRSIRKLIKIRST